MTKRALPLFILLLFAVPAYPQKGISTDNLKKHITYLAADELEGRGTGSEGEKKAAVYITKRFKEYKLVPKGNGNSYYYNFKFKPAPKKTDSTEIEFPERMGNNLVGYLDNGAEYTVVIGAHYDHLGQGHDHNSLDANPEGKIHNGADDNASGVAGVLELARYFSTNDVKEKFNFLFICFSGEELGLYGSKKYCESPTIDLAKVNYMINMDMIGRLNDSTKRVIIYGVGTAPEWVPIIDWIKSDFSIKKDSAGIGPSDQTSFYLKDIPVLHFFTGQHADYHKPSDDVEKINYEGEKQVLEFIIKVIGETEKLPKLKFQKTKSPDTGKSTSKVTMGVMPDYTYEGKGMRIDGVTDGKPAAKAGLQKGDVIIMLGDKPVGSTMDYMKALSGYNKGDTVTVTVLRDGKEVKLPVTF
ncbi:MAG: M20/M25/M40 family metallo-hydrolase [Bacteroidota bacterium]